MMDIEIRQLTPELADDYVRFFDTTPHATQPARLFEANGFTVSFETEQKLVMRKPLK